MRGSWRQISPRQVERDGEALFFIGLTSIINLITKYILSWSIGGFMVSAVTHVFLPLFYLPSWEGPFGWKRGRLPWLGLYGWGNRRRTPHSLLTKTDSTTSFWRRNPVTKTGFCLTRLESKKKSLRWNQYFGWRRQWYWGKTPCREFTGFFKKQWRSFVAWNRNKKGEKSLIWA